MEFKNVSFSYGEFPAVKDFSYSFERGKTYCIEGPNGCGKSSLFRIMTGLSFPDKGQFIFDGEEITEKKMKRREFATSFHQKQGFLFQNSEGGQLLQKKKRKKERKWFSLHILPNTLHLKKAPGLLCYIGLLCPMTSSISLIILLHPRMERRPPSRPNQLFDVY